MTSEHIKALTRKNFINWKRSPVCSSVEIICPVLLMIVLVYIRTLVPIKHLDIGGLDQYKHPTFPALIYTGNPKKLWIEDFKETNNQVSAFFNYDNYTAQAIPNQTSENLSLESTTYNITQDYSGPLFNLPTQCLTEFSFTHPAQASPLIGVVTHGSLAENITVDYLSSLFAYQWKQAGPIIPHFKIKPFATKQDLWDYVQSNQYYVARFGHDPLCYAFELIQNSANSFEANMYFNDQLKYSGRFGIGVPSQKEPAWNAYTQAPNMEAFENYQRRGYAYLHNLLANAILLATSGVTTASINVIHAPVPAEVYIEDDFGSVLVGMLPFFLLVMFIPPVYNSVFLIVKEKESKVRESMRMMGLTDTPYWLSWFIFYTLVNTAMVTLAWIMLLINVINYSQPFWWWLFFWLYGEAVFGQIIFTQSLFTRSKFAGLIATLIFFGASLANLPLQSPRTPYTTKLVGSLFPQVAMYQIATVIAEYESTGVGIRWENLSLPYLNYTYTEGITMLIVDLILYVALGLYLDKVLPRPHGQRQSCCFCLSPVYWGCRRKVREVEDEEEARRGSLMDKLAAGDASEFDDDNFESRHIQKGNYEPVSAETAKLELKNAFFQVKNLHKIYDNGFKAVAGLNLRMYAGQIFALLGHNGAGKTSFISIITGLLQRSRGRGQVFDLDLFEQMDEVRQVMGVCPQHDVLFELLTPEEHLDIFYDFKGGDPAKKQGEISKLIKDVGLTLDKDKQAGSLSGGNRRKLSVSIALCGGSKLVLLDEPTSGMDLQARRSLWNMLRSYRRDRIILLTTHYMDEADILGDRIGIMINGQLKCLGSSIFLKNRFSAGFKLTVIKKTATNELIEPFLCRYFFSFVKTSEIGQEATFLIPQKEQATLKTFFEDFDRNLERLEIKSYGVSNSSLEEVFLKINQEFSSCESKPEGAADLSTSRLSSSNDSGLGKVNHSHWSTMIDSKDSILQPQTTNVLDETLIRSSGLFLNLYALVVKRFHLYRRDICSLFCELLIPVALLLIGISFVNKEVLYQSPSRTLATSELPTVQRIVMNSAVVKPTGTDVPSTLEFYNNLPNSTEAFSVTWSDAEDYYSFYNVVAAQRDIAPDTPYRFASYQIYHADRATQVYQVNSFTNTTAQDAAALVPQYLYESILRTALNDSSFNFTVTTEPFPVFFIFKEREKAGNAMDYAFMVAIGLSLIPTVIVSFILKEREENLKHMQLISGMNKCGYWISNTLADITKAYIPVLIIILLTRIFNVNYEGVWVLYLLFPPAIVMFSYSFSFLFKSETNAQISIFALNFLVSGVMSILVITLQIIPMTEQLGNHLRWWCCLIPTYCVTHSIIWSSSSEIIITAQPDLNPNLWAWTNLKGDAACLIGHFVVGLLFLTIVECDVFACLRKRTLRKLPAPKMDLVLDDDVLAEEERVRKQFKQVTSTNDLSAGDDQENDQQLLAKPDSDVIKVSDFRKTYTTLCGKPFLAVERISFGLDYGECFALLGVNGAGKSTTFKSLTGDVLPTTGKITIAGFDIQRDFKSARKMIGYCPQKDAIFPLLTVEEHLWFYVRIKGVPRSLREAVVEKAIVQLNLAEHRKKPAGTLSGGNKRKLSVAIATLGNPPIILLDEPSAGMDPEARRFMWSVVEQISQRDKKSAVILTTHSMEEAEALSTKMGIMVRGGIFKCFGSSQHIKNKYGTGYEVQFKIRKPSKADLEAMLQLTGVTGDMSSLISLSDAKNCCLSVEKIILEEIKEDGLGSDLATESQANDGRVIVENLLQYLFVQINGIKIISSLASIFDRVEMVEQCADFFKLKVPRKDVTIGYLFGMLEDQKTDLNISEYSVSQTSLEQIFQQFANMEIDEKPARTFIMRDDKLVLWTDFVERSRSNVDADEEAL